MDGGVGEGDSALGHTEEFEGLLGGDGDLEGGGVSEADVFGGGNDETSGDETGVFSGVEHFGEPVEGGIGIRAADGLDEGGDGVVVLVAIGVVEDGLLLNGFGGDGEVEDDGAIDGRGGENCKFERGEGFAGVAIGFFGEVVEGVVVGLDGHFSKAPFFVMNGAVEEGNEVGGGDGFELENLGAGDEGGVDVEVGIVGGGSDEADGAAFEVGEEGVLLGFVEAVDFVDEEDGGLVSEGLKSAGGFDFCADFGDVGFDSVEGFKAGAGGAGDDIGEGGFSSAGRAVENEGGEAVGLDGATEEFTLGEDVLLARDLGHGAGTHAGGEGFAAVVGHHF